MSEKAIKKNGGQSLTFYIPNTEEMGTLEQAKPAFSLTMKYKSADEWATLKDKPLRCYFMGMKDVPNEDGELITCGMFVSQKEVFISGQMVLVEAVKSLDAKTPLEITYRGKVPNKSSDGSTF